MDNRPVRGPTTLPLQSPDPARLRTRRMKGAQDQAPSLTSTTPSWRKRQIPHLIFWVLPQLPTQLLPATYPQGCGPARQESIRCCWISIFPSSFGRASSRSLSKERIWRKRKSWLFSEILWSTKHGTKNRAAEPWNSLI